MKRIVALLVSAAFLGSCEETVGAALSNKAPHPLGAGFQNITPVMPGYLQQLRIDQGGFLEQTLGLVGDLDGDGVQDVVICRTQPAGSEGPCAVFSYRDGAMALRTDIAQLPHPVMAIQDLDGDAIPDLVLMSGPEYLPSVAWGLGGGRFSQPYTFPFAPENGRSGSFPVGMTIADVDGDGLPDVLFVETVCWARPGTDPGRDMMLFLNQGNRQFHDRSDLLEKPPLGSIAFSVRVTGQLGERTILFMNNSCGQFEQPPALEAAQSFFVQDGTNADGFPLFRWKNLITKATNALGGPDDFNLSHCSPMGEAEGDFDRNGIPDWVVTCDSAVILYERLRDGSYRDRSSKASPWIQGPRQHYAMTPWGVVVTDVDRDGWEDIFVAYGYDAHAWKGPQHAVLLINDGTSGFRFIDQTTDSGLGMPGDFMSLGADDLDGSGKPSFVVGGLGMPPQIYLNKVENGNHGFSLRLRGTTSVRNGEGARVFIRSEGLGERVFLAGSFSSPLVTSYPMIFVGLGSASVADATIHWLSGVIQEVKGLASGVEHEIVEPQTLFIEPASRHVRADGVSVARIMVTPRTPDGSVDMSAQVVVKITHGQRSDVSVVNADPSRLRENSGAVVAEIRAPSVSGSSVVEVSINGVPLKVRPRIWWDAMQ